MDKPYHYRNKAQYPFGLTKNNEPIVGIFAQRTHDIIPMEWCKIQHPISEILAKIVLKLAKDEKISIYNEKTGKGLLRHIVVKIGFSTKQVMCILVINGEKLPQEQKIVEKLLQEFAKNATLSGLNEYQLTTIIMNKNTKNTNVILGNENIVIYGNGYIYDKLGEYTFKISPLSFYQTNPVQTEVLYRKAIEYADLQGQETLLDLYCGIGTIAIFASQKVKKVYGIEIVEQAIEDAKENAKLNNVDNIEFLCGDVETTLEQVLEKSGIPDVIFVDPPRRGLDVKTVQNILKVKPKKLIYISCNPATMVRDLKLLEETYEIKKVQPVDMFPFTSHVECVAVLEVKKTIEK